MLRNAWERLISNMGDISNNSSNDHFRRSAVGQDSDELEEVEKEIQEKEAKQSKDEAKRINALAKVHSTPVGAVLAPNACSCYCSSRDLGSTCGLLAAICAFSGCTNNPATNHVSPSSRASVAVLSWVTRCGEFV